MEKSNVIPNDIPKHNTIPESLDQYTYPGEGIDEYTLRKRQLMQYLQNESWHDVDRILDKIKVSRESKVGANPEYGDFLKQQVEHEYKMRMRAGKKFIEEKNRLRLERRMLRAEMANRNVDEEDSLVTFVPSGTEAISALDSIDTGSNGDGPKPGTGDDGLDVVEEEICHELQSSQNEKETLLDSTLTSPSSLLSLLNDDDDDDNDNDMLVSSTSLPTNESKNIEKNRLLALFEKEEEGRNAAAAKVNLMDLLNNNDYFSDAGESESYSDEKRDSQQSKKKSLLDLLDDDFFDSDEIQTDVKDRVEPDAGKSFQVTSIPGDNTSLLDLLGHDPVEMSSVEKKSPSLLDLLNDDFEEKDKRKDSLNELSEDKQDASSNQLSDMSASGSLLNLLDGAQDIEQKPTAQDSSSQKSLLDLLDDDFTAEEDYFDKTVSTTGTKSSEKSLLHLLDDQEGDWSIEDGSRTTLHLDNLDGRDFSVGNEAEEAAEEIEIEEVIEAFSLRDTMVRVQSLVYKLRRHDWDALNRGGAVDSLGSEEISTPPDHQQLMSDLFDDTGDDLENNGSNRGNEFVDELLMGSCANKWALRSDEFNLLILHVATSLKNDKIEKVLDIFLHMKELESSGRVDAGPNPTTYAILLNLFESHPGASAIAYDICNQLVECIKLNHEKMLDNEINEADCPKMIINEDSLNAALRIQTRRLDMEGAETIMDYALSEGSGGLRVSPNAFKMMLLLYKSFEEQNKALHLIEACIEVRHHHQITSLLLLFFA